MARPTSTMKNYVVENEILKAQQIFEDKARCGWHNRWGFYLDFNKKYIENAAKRGITIKKQATMTDTTDNHKSELSTLQPPGYVPETSAGFIGWRCRDNGTYSLEKFGALYRSPKLTLPYDPPYSSIFLG